MAFRLAIIYSAGVGIFLLSSCFAFLIASRKWHWFVRAIILSNAVLPLLLVRANDLMTILLVSHLVILAGACYESNRLQVVRKLDQGERSALFVSPRFQLLDLILILALSCGVLALLPQTNRLPFVDISKLIGMGAAIGCWSLAGFGIVCWRIKWWKKCLVAILPLAGTWIWASLDNQWFINSSNHSTIIIGWLIGLAVLATALAIISLLARFSFRGLGRPPELRAETNDSTTRKAGPLKRLLRIGTAAMLTLTATWLACSISVSFYQLLKSTPVIENANPIVFEGEPNGVIELLNCGRNFEQSPILSTSTVLEPGQETRDEIEVFSRVFDDVDLALTRKTKTWIDWSTGEILVNDSMLSGKQLWGIQSMRSVARALSVKARQEIHDGNFDVALSDGLKCIQAAESYSNDGILVTALVGIACDVIGSMPMQQSIAKASRPSLETTAAELDRRAKSSIGIDEILEREAAFVSQINGWKMRLYYWAMEESLKPAYEQVEFAMFRRVAIQAQLRISIALELYKRDHGMFPEQLSELVPRYIDSISNDPFIKDAENPKPIGYFSTEDQSQYTLYSVGLNGIDEQGVLDPDFMYTEGDLNYAEIVRLEEIAYKEYVEEQQKANNPLELDD